jgi:hypothetical protein
LDWIVIDWIGLLRSANRLVQSNQILVALLTQQKYSLELLRNDGLHMLNSHELVNNQQSTIDLIIIRTDTKESSRCCRRQRRWTIAKGNNILKHTINR